MKRIVILISIICLGAVPLRAQDTTRVQTTDADIRQCIKGDCGCHNGPVNNYSGLNSLRARLANPSWNGKFGPINTGLKFEDGRIKPLVSREKKTESEESETVSAIPTVADTSDDSPYLTEIARGEMPVGAPVYVFFSLAGTRFTDPSQTVNVNAAAELALAQNLRVKIIGAADSATGSVVKNAELSIARAEYVMNLFKERGVDEGLIEIRSEGGTDRLSPSSANRNCRIELYVR